MVLYKIITICALSLIFIEYIESVPTFGDEFVHIKIHVPKEIASSRGVLAPKKPGSTHTIIASPKVIHHYHRRRKPIKKVPKIEIVPLFEHTLLAELDKPHHEYSYQNEAKHIEPSYIEETYVVKKQNDARPITKVNTYTVVEETLHNHQLHEEYGKENVETFKVIKENEEQSQHFDQLYQPEHLEQHIKTTQLVDADHINYDYHQPQEENIEIIKSSKYTIPPKEYLPYHEPHHEENEHYHYHQQHVAKDHYNYDEPHHESIEFTKTKTTNTNGYSIPYEESGYKNYHSQNYHHEPAKETIEIIKSKKPQKYHYETDSEYNFESKNHYDYQQPEEEIIENKETKYLNSKEEYHHFKETPATNYHYSRKPEAIVGEHIYKKPINDYHYIQQSQSDYDKSPFSPSRPHSPPEINSKIKLSLNNSKYNKRPKYDGTYKKSHSSAVNVKHDGLVGANFDLPGTADHKVTETYSGFDSYRAAHVQGVGSGGYKFPLS